MCDATVLLVASMAASAAQSYGSAQTTEAQAKAQKQYGKALYDLNAKLAAQSAIAQYTSIQSRQVQQRAAIAQQAERYTLLGLRTGGTARASAARAGVAGQSLAALLQDYVHQERRAHNVLSAQGAFLDLGSELQLQAAHQEAIGRALSATPTPIVTPPAGYYLAQFFGSATQITASQTTVGPDGKLHFT